MHSRLARKPLRRATVERDPPEMPLGRPFAAGKVEQAPRRIDRDHTIDRPIVRCEAAQLAAVAVEQIQLTGACALG